MKVLHVIDSGGLYGAEVMLLNLACEQRRLGIESTICSIGSDRVGTKPIELEASSRGLDVRPLRMLPGPNIAGALRILGVADGGVYDVIHTHGYKGNILLGMLPRKMRKQPVIATLHGWTSTGGISKIRIYEWADSRILDRLDAVVLVNGMMRDARPIHRLKRVPISVIPNGIPAELELHGGTAENCPPAPDIATDQIDEFCSNGFIIGSIGRLAREKAFNVLLEALSQLRSRSVPAKVVVIGEGPERAALEQLIADKGLGKWVCLPGYRQNAHRFLSCFDAFVLSSLTEGLPISLLEAMRARVPIVATCVGAIPEVLEDGKSGILARPGDASDLARAIETLSLDPARRSTQVDAAAARLRERYTAAAMADAYLKIYEQCLERTSNVPRSSRRPSDSTPCVKIDK